MQAGACLQAGHALPGGMEATVMQVGSSFDYSMGFGLKIDLKHMGFRQSMLSQEATVMQVSRKSHGFCIFLVCSSLPFLFPLLNSSAMCATA